MTITIVTPPSVEAAITQEAEREGLSLSEYALRALLERTPGMGKEIEPDEAARRAIIERLGSGDYARPGFSTEALISDRREETRMDDERDTLREGRS